MLRDVFLRARVMVIIVTCSRRGIFVAFFNAKVSERLRFRYVWCRALLFTMITACLYKHQDTRDGYRKNRKMSEVKCSRKPQALHFKPLLLQSQLRIFSCSAHTHILNPNSTEVNTEHNQWLPVSGKTLVLFRNY